MEKRVITVVVEGGVIQNICDIPEDIQIVVRDFDVDGSEDNLTEYEGDECVESTWEST